MWAQTSVTSAEMPLIEPSRWSVEGLLQAQSVAGPGSPWMGLGGAYNLLRSTQVGIRGFLPASGVVDKSTYAVQGYARVRVVHGARTDLFFEPSYGHNFYNFIPFGSYGLSAGVTNQILPGLRVGLMGGVEVARVVIDSVGLEKRSDEIAYPKIAAISSFTF